MMYSLLTIKTDYSLLKSMIKVKDLFSLKSPYLGIVDDNLSYVMEFYNCCLDNNIKPIIGLDIKINNYHLYLYAKNLTGYKNLLTLNNLKEIKELTFEDINNNANDIIFLVPYESLELFHLLKDSKKVIYVGYSSELEKKNALLLTNNIVFINLIRCLKEQDNNYLTYLEAINKGVSLKEIDSNYTSFYPKEIKNQEDYETVLEFVKLFDLKFTFEKRYIPEFSGGLELLESLIKKGINKRLNNNVPTSYIERIKYELDVIKKMGYVDYFLIVYDYVLYAKKNGILVGPGRGSAAGSLVSYALGIIDVDPMPYNLLFERFLNVERITMPDIDLDFEYDKREQVINYIKEKYNKDHVALIMTYGTLGSKQVVRDVAKCLEVEDALIDRLAGLLNPHLSLKDNLNNLKVKQMVNDNEGLVKLYKVSMALEGLKRHISTHAAGIVISSEALGNLIPLVKSGEEMLTGFTMEYLEKLGLLKMDILAVKDLTIITNVKRLIKENLKEDIDLLKIPLDDQKTMRLFYDVDTVGVFQFKTPGIMNFLRKLKPTSFIDLVNVVALFRPGPMENIDAFIRRREGKEKIDYIDPSLEPILKDTYGIIVYQEQVIEILNKMASYTYAEADIVRRAMSKKKKDVLENEQKHFVDNAIKNGFSKETAHKVFDYIMKFANYGFNKAHSVSYALIGYWMAYLKANYRVSFMANLLNINIGSEIKIKEYADEAKKYDIKVLKPDINDSDLTFRIINYDLLMPLTAIKNVGISGGEKICLERQKGEFKDFFNFVSRCYGKGVNRKTIESLIDAGALDKFGFNHQTLINNLDVAINYAELMKDLDESLVEKPIMETCDEYDKMELLKREINAFGFFLTNHPTSKYQDGIIKVKNIATYFDKNIKMALLVERISTIKTKKGEEMGFIDGSDESGTISAVIFPKKNHLLINLKNGDLIYLYGQVTKRFDKYQIVSSNIEKID